MKKHKRHLPTCRAVNKKRYPNQDAAIRAAIRVDMIDAGHRPMNAYRCEACSDWHIGHLPRGLPKKQGAA